jgi:hypothetical protein
MEATTPIESARSAWRRGIPWAVLVAGLTLIAVIPSGDTNLGGLFFSSLRMAKPVSQVAPGATPPNTVRRLEDVAAGIVAESTVVVRDDPDRLAATADAASQLAGIPVRLPRLRSDPATFAVSGERHISASINRRQLQTLLVQAGHPDALVPAQLDGKTLELTLKRGVRIQYGNCPAPVANTLQNQLQGPPPPSTDNASCVVLTEMPSTMAVVPVGLDTTAVLEIALELNGMSPNQARDFQRLFDWRAALASSPPRSVRSYELVRVGTAPGMLIITGGRRGPTYALTWSENGIVYQLTGYGSSADALPLATSLN